MKLKLGDKVRSGHFPKETHIVREISEIKEEDGETWYAADAGEKCECCGYVGTPVPFHKRGWFSKVEED